MKKTVTLFWFRRDLRLSDNCGLYHALKDNENVLPVFIFDTQILNRLEDKRDMRIQFIHNEVIALKKQLEKHGGSLLIKYGDPFDIFQELLATFEIKAVYLNHDYEPYSRRRDEKMRLLFHAYDIPFYSFKDQVVFEKDEVLKPNGKPYTVFTPYMRRWKTVYSTYQIPVYDSQNLFHRFFATAPFPLLTVENIGFQAVEAEFPSRTVELDIIKNYAKQRDFPAVEGTSRLSVHLRFGTISIRELVKIGLQHSEIWLNELIWREFYMMILWHFPSVEDKAFKPAFDFVNWRNNEEEFQRWCNGQTGYPIVDAGMRQLNSTGFMHNRLRMITASFLTKHLLVDWRWGEAYFAQKLLDYELASNNGGWQWAASSGCDAVPYFRIFNPALQAKKFDSELKFTRKWVKELDSFSYPRPVVEHKFARERALKAFSQLPKK